MVQGFQPVNAREDPQLQEKIGLIARWHGLPKSDVINMLINTEAAAIGEAVEKKEMPPSFATPMGKAGKATPMGPARFELATFSTSTRRQQTLSYSPLTGYKTMEDWLKT